MERGASTWRDSWIGVRAPPRDNVILEPWMKDVFEYKVVEASEQVPGSRFMFLSLDIGRDPDMSQILITTDASFAFALIEACRWEVEKWN